MTDTATRPLVRPEGNFDPDRVPRIPVDDLDWREMGASVGGHPRCRLAAVMQIGSLQIHIDAYEVRKNRSTHELTAVAPALRSSLDTLGELHGCIFDTLKIDGRDYVLVMSPFAR